MEEITKKHFGNSEVQNEIEIIVRDAMKEHLQCELFKGVPNKNEHFEFDFYNEECFIIGEIYSGIDELKPGQKKKLATDCLKMIIYEKLKQEEEGKLNFKKYLVLVDNKVKSLLEGKSWLSESIRFFNIELKLVELDSVTMEKLRESKKRQGETFKNKPNN